MAVVVENQPKKEKILLINGDKHNSINMRKKGVEMVRQLQ